MWSDNKVRELVAVKVLHISLLNITMVAFPLEAMYQCQCLVHPSKQILELVLWNGLKSCRLVLTPVVINVIKNAFF
jgi:hypothetical protein